jgi:hypothetical protein
MASVFGRFSGSWANPKKDGMINKRIKLNTD